MDEPTSRLIADIYETAVDRERWPVVVDGLRALLSAPIASVAHYADGACIDILNHGSPQWCGSEYLRYYSKIDLIRTFMPALPPRRAFFRRAIIDDDLLYPTEFYNDFMRHTGGAESISGIAAAQAGSMLVVSASRQDDALPFDENDRRRLEDLLPHFEAALRIGGVMASAAVKAELTLEGWNRLSFGVVLAGADGAIYFANRVAEQLFASPDTDLHVRRARLSAVDPGQAARLERVIDGAARPRSAKAGGMMIEGALDSLLLLALPLSLHKVQPNAAEGRAALILLLETARRTSPIQPQLKTLFGLTTMESRVAAELAGGRSVEEAAAVLTLSRETVRFHLKGVYAKLGARSQADMVRIVAAALGQVAWPDRMDFEAY
jgi:DNA-binding CsgD family transcriptional regulator